MPIQPRRIRVTTVLAAALAANGFLNLATGLAPVFRLARYVELAAVPDYLRISPVQRTSGFLSVLLGIALIALGKGLYERRRRAWFGALVVLLLLMANNLYRATTPQTAILSGAVVLGLLAFRRRFDVRSDVRLGYAQLVALGGVVFALAYGAVGSYVMRAQFSGIETWTDAVYFTFVTYSTLGYGDMLPETADAKVFAVSMVAIGLTSFITAFSVLVAPAIERRLKGVLRIMHRLSNIANHVIVCGYSHAAQSVIDELRSRGAPFLVVDARDEVVRRLREEGVEVVHGTPEKNEVLLRANAPAATAIVAASDSDAENLLVAVAARDFREKIADCRLRIVVRMEDEENIGKARGVGADEVISPSTMGGRLMARKALAVE
jgi:voltage-gated potassium channel